jgi:hypothetical protein
MNRRYLEGDAADLPIGEIEQLLLQGWVVQVSPLLALSCPPNPHSRMPAQVVELAQTALGQQIVYEQAAPTAKRFALLGQARVRARLAAMEASQLLLMRRGTNALSDF